MTNLIPVEVEETVGAWVAVAAIAIVQGVNERIAGGQELTAETKKWGSEVLARLVRLRLDGYNVEDLERAAFLYAPNFIQECCDTLQEERVKSLIENVLQMVQNVVKTQAN